MNCKSFIQENKRILKKNTDHELVSHDDGRKRTDQVERETLSLTLSPSLNHNSPFLSLLVPSRTVLLLLYLSLSISPSSTALSKPLTLLQRITQRIIIVFCISGLLNQTAFLFLLFSSPPVAGREAKKEREKG